MVREPFLELRPRHPAGVGPGRVVQLVAGRGFEFGLHAQNLRPGAGLLVERHQECARRLEVVPHQRPQVEEGELRLRRGVPRLQGHLVGRLRFAVDEERVGFRVETPGIVGIVREDRVGLLVDLSGQPPAHQLVGIKASEFRVVRRAGDPFITEHLAGFEGSEPRVVPKPGLGRLELLGRIVGRRATAPARTADQKNPGEQKSDPRAGSAGTRRHRTPPGQGHPEPRAAWLLNLYRRWTSQKGFPPARSRAAVARGPAVAIRLSREPRLVVCLPP